MCESDSGSRSLTDELGLELVLVPVERPTDFIPGLLDGKGDIALVKLPPPSDRHPGLLYSVPVTTVRELVVTRADDKQVSRAKDLAGRRLAVLQSLQHTRPLEELRQDLRGVEFEEITGPFSPDDLLHRVARGELDTALVDSNWMQIAAGYRSDLRVAFRLPKDQRLVGAVRANAKRLHQALNDFLIAVAAGGGRRQLSTGDLPAIRKRGVLRVLMLNRPPDYFLYRGELRGFEYELVRECAKQQKLRLEVIEPPRPS